MQADGDGVDVNVVTPRQIIRDVVRHRIGDVVDAPAHRAAEVRVNRAGRFVDRRVGAGQQYFGNQTCSAQPRKGAIDGGEADAGPLPARQRVDVAHREVGSVALLAYDLVH